MASKISDIRDQIYKKLSLIFSDNAETFTRVLLYLDHEEMANQNNTELCPALRTLKQSLNDDKVFQNYALRLAKDTKRAENDSTFYQTMALIYSRMMDVSEQLLPEDIHQRFDIAKLADTDMATKCGSMGLARAWALIPATSQVQIVDMIKRYAVSQQAVSCIDEVVGVFNKAGGNVVMVALAAISLAYDAISSILRWWKGDITGVRCCKNIIDSAFTIGAGMCGGIGGAAIGSLFGPVGTVVGGIAGGIVTSQVVNLLMDRLTQTLFGIPKEEALENAYKYLGVKMNASNNEINTAFRQLCLKHHPDKGGNTEDFHFVQVNMGVIKAARGQLY